MILLYITFLIELLSAIIGFAIRKTLVNRGLKFFPIFMLIQFFNVLASSIYLKLLGYSNNIWMYKLFMLFDLACFAYLFHQILENIKFKKIVIYLTIGFYIFYFIDRFFIQNNGEYLSFARSVIGFYLVVFSLMYFFNLFDFAKPEENLTQKVDFWIVIGIFFFYLTSVVLLRATNYMIALKSDLLKYYNPYAMKFLAMSLYIIGFLCNKPPHRQI